MLLIRYGLIRRSGLLGRCIMRLPMWLPVYVTDARIGLDTGTYLTIKFKGN